MMAFLYSLKKQPENLDLAVGITYFVYVLEPVANSEDATYHEHKLFTIRYMLLQWLATIYDN